jgi:hypothetical protein
MDTCLTLVKITKYKLKNGTRLWKCKCTCGKYRIVSKAAYNRGDVKRCVDCAKKLRKQCNRKHGASKSKIYGVYLQLKARTLRKSHIQFSRYRKLGLCKRWLKFENFLKDMGYPPSDKHSIDRINNNKGYSKANCRWATRTQQNRNTNRNLMFTYKGITACLSELIEIFKPSLSYDCIHNRVTCLKWTIEKAMSTPKEVHNRRKNIDENISSVVIQKARDFKKVIG